MNKEYLPSKTFIIRIASILIIIGVVFGIYQTYKYFKNRSSNNGLSVIKEIKKGIDDDNNNGIPNWEESLWGLDPAKDGKENKKIIDEKKASLSIYSNDSYSDKYMSQDNKELTKEFFSVLMSLQQSGNLDEESIQLLSENIGQKIEAVPIQDVYTIDMIKTVSDSEDANITYFESLNALLSKYENEDIGQELTILSQGLGSNDPQAIYVIGPIASAYQAFGRDLIKIPAPNSIAPIQLDLANNYEKTGQSLAGLTKTLSDPIVGMRALINYKQYSDALVGGLDKLSESLQ